MKKSSEMGKLRRFLNFVATWREHRRTIKLLNGLTDRELSDIGISRSDIDRLIWLGEDKTLRKRGYADQQRKPKQ